MYKVMFLYENVNEREFFAAKKTSPTSLPISFESYKVSDESCKASPKLSFIYLRYLNSTKSVTDTDCSFILKHFHIYLYTHTHTDRESECKTDNGVRSGRMRVGKKEFNTNLNSQNIVFCLLACCCSQKVSKRERKKIILVHGVLYGTRSHWSLLPFMPKNMFNACRKDGKHTTRRKWRKRSGEALNLQGIWSNSNGRKN